MFVKHAFNRIRTVVHDARLAVPVARPRGGLAAAWRRDPISGRLELKWQAAGGGHDLADLPSPRRPKRRPDVGDPRRATESAPVTMLARRAAA